MNLGNTGLGLFPTPEKVRQQKAETDMYGDIYRQVMSKKGGGQVSTGRLPMYDQKQSPFTEYKDKWN